MQSKVVVMSDLNVSVDVEAVIFASKDHGSIVHESDIKALSVLDLGLQGRQQLTVLIEHGQVEVVVVVGNCDLPVPVDAHSDRVVRYAYSGRKRNKYS